MKSWTKKAAYGFVTFALVLMIFQTEIPETHAAAVNLALGKPYVSSLNASNSYPDTSGTELTDGIYANGSYTKAAWQGRENVGSYTQTIDLQQSATITEVWTNFLEQPGVGIYWPQTVSFAYSTDGTSFTSLGNATPATAVGTSKKYELTLSSPVQAQYVRMTVTDPGGWVFEDEMEVWGEWDGLPPQSPVLISGSIFQPVYAHSWTQSDFEAEFDRMKDVGMDHMIMQWTIQRDALTKEVYYTSALYNGTTGYFIPNNHDMLSELLTAAQNKGIDIWVGISWSDDWWTKASTDFTWLADEASFATSVIQDIWTSTAGYSSKSSFKGWYISWEIDNVNYTSSAQQLHMRDALKTIVDYAKTNTSKPVMISPFFNDSMGQTASEWRDMWTYFLDDTAGADIDIVALQDGIGVHHADTTTIDDWLIATKQATDTNTDCELWANIETFDDIGNDTYRSASIDRIFDQIDAESPYVTKMTSYSFTSYQSPQVVGIGPFDDWKRLTYPLLSKTYGGPAAGIENKALNKTYTVSVAANANYPDTNGTELTDGVYASGLWQGEPSYQGRRNKTTYAITIDLGASVSFYHMSLDFLKEATSNVYLPASVEFLTSPDNVSFTSRGTVSQLSDPLDAASAPYRLSLGSPVTARYVKAIVTTGTTKWTMIDEFEVVGNR